MTIKSYLIWPKSGSSTTCLNDLTKIKLCQVTPSDDQQAFIMISETSSKQDDELIENQLNKTDSIEHYSLVFASEENLNQGEAS